MVLSLKRSFQKFDLISSINLVTKWISLPNHASAHIRIHAARPGGIVWQICMASASQARFPEFESPSDHHFFVLIPSNRHISASI